MSLGPVLVYFESYPLMSERVTMDKVSLQGHTYTQPLVPAGSLDYFLDLFNKRYRSLGDSRGPAGQVHLQIPNCVHQLLTLSSSGVWMATPEKLIFFFLLDLSYH